MTRYIEAELSRFYGADEIVDPSKPDAISRIISLSGGRGVNSAIEALGAETTFENAKVAKAGGTVSNIGYHGSGEFVRIPGIEWGVGMAEKTIRTSACAGGSLRLKRLLRLFGE
ncbi:MAG TPA: zinc-binding dehydrogenase [Nitrososphaerales archaeon]|nr:zinc-binding dehydrogenase [Nitrososphaerales archaeon]